MATIPNGGAAYQVSDGNTASAVLLGTDTVTSSTGAGLYFLTEAVTANTTTTSAPAGSIGVTTNATGNDSMFMSDGSKWQFAVVA
tara:strand:+ start:5949 stop:6203 length:255 start_codon:yes stop_codon:yes gene_type:complete